MEKTRIFLISIFLVTIIPTIFMYITHALEEGEAYDQSIKKGDDYKATKQLAESALFMAIGMGYLLCAFIIIIEKDNPIPYYAILVGTVAVVILYYSRINGIPIPFTDIIIRDMSTGFIDQVTKICQQILVIPVTALLILRLKEK